MALRKKDHALQHLVCICCSNLFRCTSAWVFCVRVCSNLCMFRWCVDMSWVRQSCGVFAGFVVLSLLLATVFPSRPTENPEHVNRGFASARVRSVTTDRESEARYDVCCMLYVVGCASWAELMPSWGYMLSTLGLLGSTLGPSLVMSGPYWGHYGRSWGYLGPPWSLRFRV